MMLWCRLCEKEYPPHLMHCPIHVSEELVLVPPTMEPAAEEAEDAPRTVCWDCGHVAVNATNDTCANCHESLRPPALVIGFPDGRVVLRTRQASAHLGRAGAYGHIFGRYPNVSRQHAAVIVDADGDAWIQPVPAAPNGTFVNGHEILTRTRLALGDEIRFAAEGGPHPGPVSVLIRQPQREPQTPTTGP